MKSLILNILISSFLLACCFGNAIAGNTQSAVECVDNGDGFATSSLFTFMIVGADEVAVTKGGEPDKKGQIFDIPAKVKINGKTYRVTQIADRAFAELYDRLVGVNLPDGITYIGHGAFANTHITSIKLPDSLTDMGEAVFKSCGELQSCTLSAHLKTISVGTFNSCFKLSSITIPYNITCIDRYAFGFSAIKEIHLPAHLEYIGDEAFDGCPLERISLPNGLLYIGNFAFRNCKFLTSVAIPDKIRNINSGMFSGCRALTTVVLPGTLRNIWIEAFKGCENLTSINVSGQTKVWENAFEGCLKLKR